MGLHARIFTALDFTRNLPALAATEEAWVRPQRESGSVLGKNRLSA
jgi:hypothetical protein